MLDAAQLRKLIHPHRTKSWSEFILAHRKLHGGQIVFRETLGSGDQANQIGVQKLSVNLFGTVIVIWRFEASTEYVT